MHRPPPIPRFVVPPSQITEPASSSAPIDLRQTFVESFLAARDLQPNSRRSYQQDLQQFMDWCDRPWNSVSQRQVIGFKTFLIDDRKLSVEVETDRDPKLNRSTVSERLSVSRLQQRSLGKSLCVIG